MNIMLGNLTVSEIEERAGVDFPEELRELLEKTHQSNAKNIADGEWHYFDIPFALVVGGMPFAQKIYDFLKPEANNFNEPFQIVLANSN